MRIIILFIIFFAANSTFAQDIQYWQHKYDSAFAIYKTELIRQSESGNSYWYYFLSYGLDGSIAMYEATGDIKYLDFSLLLVNNVINDAQPTCEIPGNNSKFKKCYKGWISLNAVHGNKEIALNESYFFRYVCRLLRVLKQDTLLYGNTVYREQLQHILRFTEINVWEKWYSRGLKYIYPGRTHMASHWAFIALDLSIVNPENSTAYQEVFNNYNSEGFPRAKSVYQGASLWKQQRHEMVDSHYFSWKYSTWDNKSAVQDVSHANNVIAYIIESYSQNSFWDIDDITGLKILFWRVVTSDTGFNDCFETTKICFDGKTPMNRGTGKFQTDGWIKLGRYDTLIQRFYSRAGILRITTGYLPHLSFNAYAHLAYNAKVLRENEEILKHK